MPADQGAEIETDTQTQPPVADAPAPAVPGDVPLVEQDLLVEDISIDGMCGVY